MPDSDTRRYLTKSEAAVYTGLSTRTIERAVGEQRLRAGGPPRRRRFLREWLDEWMIAEGRIEHDERASA